jgi:hypothetical protein
MNIEKKGNLSFEISGNIKSLDDLSKIKSAIEADRPKSGDSLKIVLKDSISMPSAVIGYFLKLVKKEGVNIRMSINDKRLEQLLSELNLKSVFNF